MTRNLMNWKFDDVVSFLEQHFFILVKIEGSHHFFRGLVDGQQRLTFIQKHSRDFILPKSLNSTIHKSGIPKEIWKKWGNSGNNKARKLIQYSGAQKF